MSPYDRFLQALAFLTLFPVGAKYPDTAENRLFACARYFPAAGLVVGFVAALAFYVASQIWPPVLAAMLAVTASMAATGALHEDGLADSADGFGGGATRDARLAIMKDSRVGSFGALALILDLGLRIFSLAELPLALAFFGLIGAHAAARFAPVYMLAFQDYGGDQATAKIFYAGERLPRTEWRYAGVWTLGALLPIFLLRPGATLLALGLAAILAALLARYSRNAIGGYCGDVLGAIEQLFEIGFLLGLAGFAT